MKIFKTLLASALSVLAIAFTSCEDELQFEGSRAIMISESDYVTHAGAHTDTLVIYADKGWKADVTDTWLSIDPKSGEGTTKIAVTFELNDSDNPRSAELVVKGSPFAGDVKSVITQKGDKYRNMNAVSVSDALALKEGDMVKLGASQIMALTTTGFVVSDGQNAMYVNGRVSEPVGAKVTVTGVITSIGGLNAIELEDAVFVSEGIASYPEPMDITDRIKTFAPERIVFVTVSGSCSGIVISVDDNEIGQIYNPVVSLGIKKYDMHNVSLTGYCARVQAGFIFIPIAIEDKGMAAQIYLQFEIETAEFKNANASFGILHSFNAIKGDGYIKYIPENLAGTDPDGVWKMDISGNDPRCTGPFTGDYWLFYGNAPIKSGSVVRIKFGSRVSKTGNKYWILEYLDGKTWKVAGTPKVSEDTDIPKVTYTHQQADDGSTNITIDETVTFTRNVEHGQFRFRSVTSKQANDGSVLTKRNTGSARLAVSSAKHVAPQPMILIVSEGDGTAVDPLPANITVSADYLSFEGAPAGPKTLIVSSDQEYSLSTSATWINVDVTGGAANEEKTVNVTCAPSELSTLREGKVIITSGETVKEIHIFQSAAGQDLEPFISIVGGNTKNVGKDAGSISVDVQANIDYNAEVSEGADWITIAPVTKAPVEIGSFTLDYAENTGEERVGKVRFYNNNGLESVLTIIQRAAPGANVYFEDTFDWIEPWSSVASNGIGDSVGDNHPKASGYAPNLYTSAPLADLLVEFQNRYIDLNPASRVVYPQKNYLKFGKTSSVGQMNETGITINQEIFPDDNLDATLTFDYCPQVGDANDKFDDFTMVVELSGDGTVDGGKISNPFKVVIEPDANGKYNLKWTAMSFDLKGVGKNTKVTIRPESMENATVKRTRRWFIDNLKIEKAN
ncbi:MAG: BACON domain-containing protein [Candidatus Cryptobacteroides sp.]|jgi:hypothetical protein